MKKLILLIYLLVFSSISLGIENQSTISVSASSKRDITPDQATIKFSITQKGKSFNDNKINIEKKYNAFMKELKNNGIIVDQINIDNIDYSSLETVTETNSNFTTKLGLIISSDENNIITQLMKIDGIKSVISTDNQHEYIITISSNNENKNKSWEQSFNTLKKVKSLLEVNNIYDNNIKLYNYSITEISNNDKTTKEYVTTTDYSFKTKSISNIPKLLKISEKYNVTINQKITFDISNYNLIDQELYDDAFNKAKSKAKTILSNLGATVTDTLNIKETLQYNDFDIIRFNSTKIRSGYVEESLYSYDMSSPIDFVPKKINLNRELFVTFGSDKYNNKSDNRFVTLNEIQNVSIPTDKAIIDFTINTKNKNNETAIKENDALYNKFISILNSLNISYDEIESVNLKTSQYENNDRKLETLHSTTMTVVVKNNLTINEMDKLITVLNSKNIDLISNNNNNDQIMFTLNSEKFNNKDRAYSNILSKYQDLLNDLIALKFDNNKINIYGIDYNEENKYIDDDNKNTMYEINKTYSLTTKDLSNTYNIIMALKLLNFDVFPFITLKIDNIENMQHQSYKQLFDKINIKKNQIASSSNTNISNFKTIVDNSNNDESMQYYIMTPYLNSISNNIDTKDILSKSTSSYVKEIKNNMMEFIVPEFEKNINIEIEFSIE